MKCWKNGMASAVVLAMALVAGGCARTAAVVVTREVVGPPVVGFGGCMNPYVYGPPNWPGEVNGGNVGKLESEVKALRPQFVRVFFLQSWWDKDTDPVIAKGKPGMRESLIKTVRLAQQAGAKVLLQFWYDPQRYKDPDEVARRFAGAVAEMRGRYGLSAVRYVTVQNEPNDNGKDVTPEQYVRVYRALDGALKEQGIRKEVEIIGGDLVSVHEAEWVQMLGRELSPVLDGYSMHAYWGYWDTGKLVRRIREMRQQVDALPAEQRRPLFVTEFGVQGHRPKPNVEPGFYDDGRVVSEVPAACAQIAWFMMEAVNDGFVGTAQWDLYEAWYDRKMGYGVIGAAERGFPRKPGYWLLSMFTKGVEPGARAVRVEGRDDAGIVAAAVRNPDGRVVLFLLNVGTKQRRVRVEGVWADSSLRVEVWNRSGDDGNLWEGPSVEAKGSRGVSVPVGPGTLVRLDD